MSYFATGASLEALLHPPAWLWLPATTAGPAWPCRGAPPEGPLPSPAWGCCRRGRPCCGPWPWSPHSVPGKPLREEEQRHCLPYHVPEVGHSDLATEIVGNGLRAYLWLVKQQARSCCEMERQLLTWKRRSASEQGYRTPS